jgi:hypothetical protein
MQSRLVVCFRATGGPGKPFPERARALVERLASIGAEHVGWDALKVTFALPPEALEAVFGVIVSPGEEEWAVGLAEGDLGPLAEAGSPLLASGLLHWGPAFVAASALASHARGGEALAAESVRGDLLSAGVRIARDGALRVRGHRIDRRQPWKRQARQNLAKLREPRLLGAHLPVLSIVPGELVVLRADPGAGGTRLLHELADRTPRALYIAPVGSGFEPLGALRRALGRSVGQAIHPLLLELSSPLEALLAGKGITLDLAAKLVTAFLWPKQAGTHGAVIVDDAKSVDPATLEACVRAVERTPSFGMAIRLDTTSSVPSMLSSFPASEHVMGDVSRETAEEIALGATGGALDPFARVRWARRGGGNPLAIVEAITAGVVSGELMWVNDRAVPRSRAAGRGGPLPAAKWIRKRANAESSSARVVLSLLAVIGGESNIRTMERVLELAEIEIDVAAAVRSLEQARFIVQRQESDGWYAFVSRTHRKALFTTLEEEPRRTLHRAIARALEEREGTFGRVEAAWHAAQAGAGPGAAATFLEAAKVARAASFGASAAQLVTFARRIHPACEDEASSQR